MVAPGSKMGGSSPLMEGSSRGQISYLTKYGHVIYKIEGINEMISLEHFLSKANDYVIQNGRRKVKRSFFY